TTTTTTSCRCNACDANNGKPYLHKLVAENATGCAGVSGGGQAKLGYTGLDQRCASGINALCLGQVIERRL
ncbi:hypothetical protein, partial [Pseudomonas savastanoi]